MKRVNINKALIVLIILIAIIIGYKNKNTNENVDLVRSQDLSSQEALDENNLSNSNIEIEESSIFVHISGQVNKPGLYELEVNSRLNDLVIKAGGLTESADIMSINLSQILNDQDRIHIYELGELKNDSDKDSIIINNSSKLDDNSKISINKATLEELMTLPGIGEKRAQDIIDMRAKSKIKSLDELLQVKGLGPKSVEKLKDLLNFD